jgi:hypothetical protein
MRDVIRNYDEGVKFIHRVFTSEVGDRAGKPLTISVRPFQSFRNLDQNKKCHAMIRELAEFCGHSEKEMKRIVKAHFGPYKVVELPASVVPKPIPKGTSEYTIQEMSDFIERLYQLGAEIGCQFSED